MQFIVISYRRCCCCFCWARKKATRQVLPDIPREGRHDGRTTIYCTGEESKRPTKRTNDECTENDKDAAEEGADEVYV